VVIDLSSSVFLAWVSRKLITRSVCRVVGGRPLWGVLSSSVRLVDRDGSPGGRNVLTVN
jgi:hypothetical protein